MYFNLQCESRSGDWTADEPLDRTVAEFEAESLGDLLERLGRFIRGCGCMISYKQQQSERPISQQKTIESESMPVLENFSLMSRNFNSAAQK